ncbi:MAG: GNAT family N-acetyltransferase [Comamonas sp.]
MLWIRPANVFDAPVLGDLHAASWRNAYRDMLSDAFLAGDVAADRRAMWARRLSRPAANEHVFLAGAGHAALGFVSMFGDEDPQWGSYINNLHVQLSQQCQGIGTQLLHACAGLCTQRYSHAGLYLWVAQSNEKAQRFYLHHGARNQGDCTWRSPEGREVALHRLVWTDVAQLQQATTHRED